jgi:hypothetical protein
MLHFFFGTYKNIHEIRNLREDMREDYTTAWRLSSSFPSSKPRGLYGRSRVPCLMAGLWQLLLWV